jgi:tetratricopeptide (TPR) repeat protein
MDEKDCADYRMWASDNVRLYEKGWEGYSYEKALYYYKKALEICVDYQDNIMASIREVEEKMNIGESSRVGNEQASQCNDLLEQADTYYYTGDTENALATYQKALNSGNCEQEYIAQQIDLLSGGSDDVVIETVEKEGPEMTQSGPPETEPCKCPPGEQVIEEPEWYYDENTGNYMKVGDCICEKIQKTDHAEIDVELNYCGTEMDMVISELERFYKGNISDLNIETYMAKLEKIADRLVGLECIPTDDQMARWQEVILNLAEHLNMGTELMPSLTDTKKDKRVPVIPKHDGIPEALPNPGVVIIDNSKNKNSERNVLPDTKFPKAELEPGNASLNNDEDFERRTRDD